MIHSTIYRQPARTRTSGLLSLVPLSLFPANFPTAPTAKRLSKLLLLGLSLLWLFSCESPSSSPTAEVAATAIEINGNNPLVIDLSNAEGSNTTGTLFAIVTPNDHTDGEVDWVSSNTNVITLTKNSAISATYRTVSEGTTTVTASVGGVSDNLSIIVPEAPPSYLVTNIIHNFIVFTNSIVRHFSNFANVYFGTNTYVTVTYTTNAEAFSLLLLSNNFTVTNINVPYQTIIRNITNEIEPDIEVVTSSNMSGTNTSNYIRLMGLDIQMVDGTNDKPITNLIASTLVTTTDFSGVNFSDRDLSYLDLAGFDLSHANLRNANLSRTCLLSANITGADFTGANTNGTIFTFIQNITNVTDGGSLELRGARGVTTAEVGSTTYLFVAGRDDNGVSVFSVGDDGGLSNVTNVSDNSSLELGGAWQVTTAEVGSTTYLFVAGIDDNGISVFSVGDDGGLSNVTNVSDNSSLELDGARSIMTADVSGTTYLFVAGQLDDGISVFSVGDGGGLSNVTNVSDGGSLELDGAWAVTTAEVGSTTYLFVTGDNDNGFSVFSVGDDGGLSNVANVQIAGTILIITPRHLTTSEVGSTTYLFVSLFSDSILVVFSVGDDGDLSHVINVSDDSSLELDGVNFVATEEVEGTNYLFVTGIRDNGMSVFSVANDGRLSNVTNVQNHRGFVEDVVDRGFITTAEVGGIIYLFVTGFFEDNEVSVFSVGCGSGE